MKSNRFRSEEDQNPFSSDTSMLSRNQRIALIIGGLAFFWRSYLELRSYLEFNFISWESIVAVVFSMLSGVMLWGSALLEKRQRQIPFLVYQILLFSSICIIEARIIGSMIWIWVAFHNSGYETEVFLSAFISKLIECFLWFFYFFSVLSLREQRQMRLCVSACCLISGSILAIARILHPSSVSGMLELIKRLIAPRVSCLCIEPFILALSGIYFLSNGRNWTKRVLVVTIASVFAWVGGLIGTEHPLTALIILLGFVVLIIPIAYHRKWVSSINDSLKRGLRDCLFNVKGILRYLWQFLLRLFGSQLPPEDSAVGLNFFAGVAISVALSAFWNIRLYVGVLDQENIRHLYTLFCGFCLFGWLGVLGTAFFSLCEARRHTKSVVLNGLNLPPHNDLIEKLAENNPATPVWTTVYSVFGRIGFVLILAAGIAILVTENDIPTVYCVVCFACCWIPLLAFRAFAGIFWLQENLHHNLSNFVFQLRNGEEQSIFERSSRMKQWESMLDKFGHLILVVGLIVVVVVLGKALGESGYQRTILFTNAAEVFFSTLYSFALIVSLSNLLNKAESTRSAASQVDSMLRDSNEIVTSIPARKTKRENHFLKWIVWFSGLAYLGALAFAVLGISIVWSSCNGTLPEEVSVWIAVLSFVLAVCGYIFNKAIAILLQVQSKTVALLAQLELDTGHDVETATHQIVDSIESDGKEDVVYRFFVGFFVLGILFFLYCIVSGMLAE